MKSYEMLTRLVGLVAKHVPETLRMLQTHGGGECGCRKMARSHAIMTPGCMLAQIEGNAGLPGHCGTGQILVIGVGARRQIG